MSSWNPPLGSIVAVVKNSAYTTVRGGLFKLTTRIIERSPVLTGRFKANWNVSYRTPDFSTTSSTDAGRSHAQARKILNMPIVGGNIHIVNALPYADALEFGYSKKAPSGMVRVSLAEFEAGI